MSKLVAYTFLLLFLLAFTKSAIDLKATEYLGS